VEGFVANQQIRVPVAINSVQTARNLHGRASGSPSSSMSEDEDRGTGKENQEAEQKSVGRVAQCVPSFSFLLAMAATQSVGCSLLFGYRVQGPVGI
jgi:hypothetical protein